MIAATFNKAEIMNYLISKGADAKIKTENGFTALHYAQSSKSDDAIAVLTAIK